MKNPSIAIMLCCAVLAATGCSSTKFRHTEKAPDVGPVDFAGKKVIALVMHPEQSVRVEAENALAGELTARGMVGVAAHTVIPAADTADKEKAKAAIHASGAEALVISRLVGIEVTTEYEYDTFGAPHYGSLMSYYGHGWGDVYAAGYLRSYNTYVIETLCYRVADEKRIWSGVSETFSPNDIESLARELVQEAGKVMQKQGLVQPR